MWSIRLIIMIIMINELCHASSLVNLQYEAYATAFRTSER